VEDFLYQIETGANATNLYYLALIGALAASSGAWSRALKAQRLATSLR
jgi:hypothetical protein